MTSKVEICDAAPVLSELLFSVGYNRIGLNVYEKCIRELYFGITFIVEYDLANFVIQPYIEYGRIMSDESRNAQQGLAHFPGVLYKVTGRHLPELSYLSWRSSDKQIWAENFTKNVILLEEVICLSLSR